jgi:hypothetical protein
MERKWRGVLHTLVGFENDMHDGTGEHFNFILSNGTRSNQRDDWYPTNHTFMITKNAIHKIRAVTIHYYSNRITGFSFFDKDGALLWKIGNTYFYLREETVVLFENERIVGVVANLYPGENSRYTDFQFQIASR